MLLPGELRERRVPCGLFAQELGLLPPRRRCLQKKSQFPVVLDGAGSSLDAFPLLFILTSSGAYCFCSRISAIVTVREVFCFLFFFRDWAVCLVYRRISGIWGRFYIHISSLCEALQVLLQSVTIPVG